MNHLLSDNRVKTMHRYLVSNLDTLYDTREAANIADVLFCSFKGWGKADILLHEQDTISESEMLKFHFALKKLKLNTPVQYVVGETWFYGLKFSVNPSVLIPRPETEELVHLILNENSNDSEIRVLDIGTGSGCIPISLKHKRPNWQVFALDISETALETAHHNAQANHAEISFGKKDILQCAALDMNYQIIVSNPPYIPIAEKTAMDANVVMHEPEVALFVSNEDPLIFYRHIIQLAKSQNSPCKVYFEIHHSMRKPLETLAYSYNASEVNFQTDMQGKDRIMHMRF
jgi:release factor glutamine methyltransferase